MSTVCDRPRLLDTLQGVMDRLSAPDLTAAESGELRPRLFALLGVLDDPKGGGRPTCGPRPCRDDAAPRPRP